MIKFALFPGSFAPYHNGHEFVYKKGCKDYDYVIIIKSKNPQKKDISCFDNNIQHYYLEWDGFIHLLCEKLDIYNIIRGYRDVSDYLYEKQLELIYRMFNYKIKVTLYESCDELRHIRSQDLRK